MSRSDRDLDALAADLSELLRELRVELRRPPRGPLGLPRPPTPRELLSFTERQAIPTAIAVLEANIRALELLADTIKWVERPDDAADWADPGRARSKAMAANRSTLDRLEAALDDLQDALEDETAGPETRRLLEEARDLRQEIDQQLRETAGRPPGSEPSETGFRTDRSTTSRGYEIPVDVEAELESIRRDLEDETTDEQ